MLTSTPDERKTVEEYYLSQSPDASVDFLQKMYSETVAGHRHDVWDVHASDGRWWVITNPTNLYSQDQFPNMDYAVTFHLGLCLRIPRTDIQQESSSHVAHFAPLLNQLQELPDALSRATTTTDYQAVGMKSRELLLLFIGVVQDLVDWQLEKPLQRANFKGWIDVIFNTVLSGESQQARRHLLKTLLNEAWTFANWLTHAKSATWYDAEAAQTATEQAISSGISLLLRLIRLVPEECPKCGSPHLSPQESSSEDIPKALWERPSCHDCGWTGIPVRIDLDAPKMDLITREGREELDECIVPEVPLRKLTRPGEA